MSGPGRSSQSVVFKKLLYSADKIDNNFVSNNKYNISLLFLILLYFLTDTYSYFFSDDVPDGFSVHS